EAGATNTFLAKTPKQAVDLIIENLKPEIKGILVKASRGMALELVINELKQRKDALPSPLPAE
ncbi:unnamed protein product, partial [marine sediment metagenome]